MFGAGKLSRRYTAGLVLLIVLVIGSFVPSKVNLADDTFRPVVRGRRGAISAGSPLAAEAGMRMLQSGGNAVDAGVASILAASVIEFSHFGFGGEVAILIKMGSGQVVAINGQGTAPQLATREFFIQRARQQQTGAAVSGGEDADNIFIPSTGPLAATVPAVLDACITALDLYGSKTLAEVMQPAIELADGFPIDELRVSYIHLTSPVYSKWPDSVRIFLPGGRAPKPGDIFVQKDLARTLREIVNAEKRNAGRGRRKALMAARDYFYNGPIARRISKFMSENGGLLREVDFARFRAKVEGPVKTVYRGYEVYKLGFGTQGPTMLQLLNLLEGDDLKAMKHNSADYIHTVVEAMKLAFADRDHYYGDPDFVRIPQRELLSKDYAALRRALIDPRRASLEHRPGDPVNMRPLIAVSQPFSGESRVPPEQRANNTTSINVIDRNGNLFSATPSGAWLPCVIAGDTGIPLSQRMQQFLLKEGHPNALEPGKRPRITLSPTLVLKDGEPFMVMSSPGGDNQDQALTQVLLNIIEFGMNVQQAVEAPRFDTRHLISTFDDHRFNPGAVQIENRISKDVIEQLQSRGHNIKVISGWEPSSAPTVVMLNSKSGVISAGADPRRHRYALAW